MKFRKLVSSLLAVCMMMSIITPALADDIASDQVGFTVDDGASYDVNLGTNTINNGIITTNSNLASVQTNNGTISNNYGQIDENASGGSVTINVNGGTVSNNKENATIKINENGATITTNSGTVSINSGTVDTNKGIIEVNAEGTVNTNEKTVVNNNGTIKENKGTIENNNRNVTDNNNGTIINNYGTIKDGTNNNEVGTIKNNYGTIEFDKVTTEVEGEGTSSVIDDSIVYENFGALKNAVYDNTKQGYVDAGTNGTDTYIYAVTYANNESGTDTVKSNEQIEENTIITIKNLSDIYTVDENKNFAGWRDSLNDDYEYEEGTPVSVKKAMWLYPTYNVSTGKEVTSNDGIIINNDGTIDTNKYNGSVLTNKGTVEKNFGTVSFDGNSLSSDAEGNTIYDGVVEKNYGVLKNAEYIATSITINGKEYSDVWVNSGTISDTIYAITYSKNGIQDCTFTLDENGDYTETDDSHVDTSKSVSMTDSQVSSGYTIETWSSMDNKLEEQTSVDILYWIDVLDGNKKYNANGETSIITSINQTMWLRPVFSATGTGDNNKDQTGDNNKDQTGDNNKDQTGGNNKDQTGGNNDDQTGGNNDDQTGDNNDDQTGDNNQKEQSSNSGTNLKTNNQDYNKDLIKDEDVVSTTLSNPEGVKIDIIMVGDKVSTSTITKEKIQDSINEKNSNGIILVDVSNVGDDISKVEFSKDSIKNIADSDATGLKAVMTLGSMTLNKLAITNVSGMTEDEGLILVVEEINEVNLSKDQKDTISTAKKDDKVVAVIDSYILSSNEKIKNLNGGKATLEINTEELGITDALAKKLIIYEVAEDGTLTKIDYEFIDGQIVFDAKILATYMFVKE